MPRPLVGGACHTSSPPLLCHSVNALLVCCSVKLPPSFIFLRIGCSSTKIPSDTSEHGTFRRNSQIIILYTECYFVLDVLWSSPLYHDVTNTCSLPCTDCSQRSDSCTHNDDVSYPWRGKFLCSYQCHVCYFCRNWHCKWILPYHWHWWPCSSRPEREDIKGCSHIQQHHGDLFGRFHLSSRLSARLQETRWPVHRSFPHFQGAHRCSQGASRKLHADFALY